MADCSGFLLRVQKSKALIKESTETMNIIIQRPHAMMADDLRKVYVDQKQVNIIVDRRYSERRQAPASMVDGFDRRNGDRRNQTERNWRMNLIVKRPYAYLVDDLQRVFQGQDDVNIVVDSRRADAERRREAKAISDDRRRGDRRKANETVVEVVISC